MRKEEREMVTSLCQRETKRTKYFKEEGVVKSNSVSSCRKVKSVEYWEVSVGLATRRMLVTFGSLVAMDAKRSTLRDEWGTENLGGRQWIWWLWSLGSSFMIGIGKRRVKEKPFSFKTERARVASLSSVQFSPAQLMDQSTVPQDNPRDSLLLSALSPS